MRTFLLSILLFGVSLNISAQLGTPSLYTPSNGSTQYLNNSIYFSWSAVSGATSYDLQFDTGTGWEYTETVYGTNINWTGGSGTHTWRVRAVNGSVVGEWSSTRTYTTVGAPSAPSLASPSTGTNINITTSQKFSWYSSSNATGYEIQFDSESPIDRNSYTYYYRTYYSTGSHTWKVRAYNPAGTSSWSSYRSFTVYIGTPSLSSPSNGEKLYVGSNETFSWSSVSGASYYEIQFDPGTSWEYTDDVFGTSISWPIVEGGIGSHTWRVRARYGSYAGSWSSTRSYTIVGIPSAPSLISPSNGASLNYSTSTTFSWSSVANATGYQIQFDSDSPINVSGTSISKLFTSVGSHTWKVRAYNPAGYSSWSSSRSFTVELGVPTLSSPSNGSTLYAGVGTNFSWSSVPGATSYDLQFDPGTAWEYTENVTETNIDWVGGEGDHSWRVRAKNGSVVGEWSATRNYTMVGIPSTPTQSSPSNGISIDYSTSTTFSWSSVANATGYQIQFDSDSPINVSGTSISKLFTSVGSHAWKVRAYNPAGYSSWSSSRSFTVELGVPTLSSPSNGSTLYAGVGTTFSWSSVPGATSYELQFDPGTDWEYTENLAETSIDWIGGEGEHSWRVRAVNGSFVGEWSSIRTYTMVGVPEAPALSSPAEGSDVIYGVSTTFSWNSTTNAESYEIQFDSDSPISVSGTSYSKSFTSVGSHTWKVRAINPAGGGNWSSERSVNVILAAPTLSTPSNGTTLYAGVGTTFSWSSVPGATSYDLQFDPGTGWEHTENLAETNTEWIGGEGDHVWRVRAVNGSVVGEWSSTRTYTMVGVPKAPTLSSPIEGASVIYGYATTYTWSSVSNSTGYQIQFDTDSPIDESTTSLSKTFNEVGSHTWKVRAVNPAGDGEWSATRSVNVTLAAPTLSSPDDGSTLYAGVGTNFSWSSVPGATSYDLQFDPGTDWEYTENLTETSIDWIGGEGEHSWRVRAVNGSVVGEWSSTRTYTMVGVPTAPTLSSPIEGASVIYGSTTTYTWSSVSNSTGYQIQFDTDSPIDESTTSLSKTFNEVGSHTWKVRAVNPAGGGDWSSERSVNVILAAPELNLPNEGEKYIVGENINFSWNLVPGAISYDFEFDSGEDYAYMESVTENSLNWIAYEGGIGTHTWQVRAKANDIVGLWSEPRTYIIEKGKVEVTINELNNPFPIQWNISGVIPEDITIKYDLDSTYGNGNETVICSGQAISDTYFWNTGGMSPGNYKIVVVATYSDNSILYEYADATINLDAPYQISLELYKITDTDGIFNTENPGTEKTNFVTGETVRVTLRAMNTGNSVPVTCVLNIFNESNQTVYDSHSVGEDNNSDSPLENGEGYDYYSFDWIISENYANIGSLSIGAAIRSSDFNSIYTTTKLGVNTSFDAGWILDNIFSVNSVNDQILQVPHYYQGSTYWCYLNSLTMLLNYYGVNIKPWDIARDDHFEKEISQGTLGYHIDEYIEKYIPSTNFEAESKDWSFNFESNSFLNYLNEQLNYGRPIWFLSWPQIHAIVIIGMKDGKIFYNDPHTSSVPESKSISSFLYHFCSLNDDPHLKSNYGITCVIENGSVINKNLTISPYTYAYDAIKLPFKGISDDTLICSTSSVRFENELYGNEYKLYLKFDGKTDNEINNRPWGYKYVALKNNGLRYIEENVNEFYKSNNDLGYSVSLADKLIMRSGFSNIFNTQEEGEISCLIYECDNNWNLANKINYSLESNYFSLNPNSFEYITIPGYGNSDNVYLANIIDIDKNGIIDNPSKKYAIIVTTYQFNIIKDQVRFNFSVSESEFARLNIIVDSDYSIIDKDNFVTIPFQIENTGFYSNQYDETPLISVNIPGIDVDLYVDDDNDLIPDENSEIGIMVPVIDRFSDKSILIKAKMPDNFNFEDSLEIDILLNSNVDINYTVSKKLKVKVIDNVLPEIELLSSYDWYNENPYCIIKSSDNYGLDNIWYQIDSNDDSDLSNWKNLTSDGINILEELQNIEGDSISKFCKIHNDDWNALNNGMHYIYFKVTDDAGNIYITPNQSSAFAFGKDNTPPTISILYPSEGLDISEESFDVFWNISDNVSGVEMSGIDAIYYAIDQNTSWTQLGPNVSSILLNSLEQGEHTIYMFAEDNANNTSNIISRSFSINSTINPPVAFNLLGPNNSTTVNSLNPQLNWEEANDPDGTVVNYEVYISSDEVFQNSTVYSNISNTTYQIPDVLNDNSIYYWKVIAIDEQNQMRWSKELDWYFVVNQVNDNPESFNLLEPTNGQVIENYSPLFNWSSSTDVDPGDNVIYTIQIDSELDFENGVLHEFSTISNQYQLNIELEPNITYYWRVKASDLNDGTTLSTEPYFSFITPNHIPILEWIEIAGFENDGVNPSIGNNETTFDFGIKYKDADNDAPASGYPLLHILKDDTEISGSPYLMTESNDINFENGKEFYYSLSGLEPGDDYHYYFEAKDVQNDSAVGAPGIISNGPVVNGIKLLTPNGGEAWNAEKDYEICWQVTGELDSIYLSYSEDGGELWDSLSYDITGNSESYYWTIPNNPGDNYKIKVTGFYDGGVISDTSDLSFTVLSPVYPPTEFSLKSPIDRVEISNFTPEFVWSTSIDPEGTELHYELWYSNNESFKSSTIIQELNDTTFIPSTPLSDNTIYYWKVKAIDQENDSTWSNDKYGEFAINLSNDPPFSFSLNSPKNDSLIDSREPTLVWDESMDVDPYDTINYEVWLGTKLSYEPGTYSVYSDLESNYFTLPDQLQLNGTYYWKVYAIDKSGERTQSFESNWRFKVDSSVIKFESVEANDVLCNGENNGEIIISVEEALGPILYSIDSGYTWQSNNEFYSDLSPGSYHLTVKDSINDQAYYVNNPVQINEPDALIISNVIEVGATEYYNSDGEIYINASGGYGELYYSVDSGMAWTIKESYEGLSVGKVNVVVKDDNECITYYNDNPLTIYGLSVTTDTIIINYNDIQNDSMLIKTNTNWNITENEDWLNVNPSVGSFHNQISILCDSNSSVIPREAKLFVNGEYVNQKELVVIQTGCVPYLMFPYNQVSEIPLNYNLIWKDVLDAEYYELQVSLDDEFNNIVISKTSLIDTTYNIDLNYSTTYYWRVRAAYDGGYSNWSNNWSFTTRNVLVTVALNNPDGGYVEGEGEYIYNSEVTLNAIPNEQYNFINWTENSDTISTNQELIFNATKDRSFTVNFEEKIKYILTIVIDGEGIVKVNDLNYTEPVESYDGTVINLEAIADEGWLFKEWGDSLISENSSDTLIMDNDKSVKAKFIIASSVEEEILSNIEIYPNPFSDYVIFENVECVERINIINLQGQVVIDERLFGQYSTKISTNKLSIGMYLIKIYTIDGEDSEIKLVKE